MADKMAILEDILKEKKLKEQELLERQRWHRARQRQQKAAATLRAELLRATWQAMDEERQQRKVRELKRWLDRKEKEARQRRHRDAEAVEEVLKKDFRRFQTQLRSQEAWAEQRERRLRVAERRRMQLEAQLLGSGRRRPLASQAQQLVPSRRTTATQTVTPAEATAAAAAAESALATTTTLSAKTPAGDAAAITVAVGQGTTETNATHARTRRPSSSPAHMSPKRQQQQQHVQKLRRPASAAAAVGSCHRIPPGKTLPEPLSMRNGTASLPALGASAPTSGGATCDDGLVRGPPKYANSLRRALGSYSDSGRPRLSRPSTADSAATHTRAKREAHAMRNLAS